MPKYRGFEQRPNLYDAGMWFFERLGLNRWRRSLVSHPAPSGWTLELGCGTGRNFSHYPPSVRVAGIDPNFQALAVARRRAPGVPLVQARAEALPFRDGAFDQVITSLVFCSVDDPSGGLLEVRRVLAREGFFRALEHVRPKGRVAQAWVRWMGPWWTYLAGGCRLDRDTEHLVQSAGFEISSDAYKTKGILRSFAARRGQDPDSAASAPRPPRDRSVRTIRTVLWLVGIAAIGSGCDLISPENPVCTTEFRMLTLRIQDEGGTPITNARVDVRPPGGENPWPGTGLRDDLEAGIYVVVHDGHAELVGRGRQATLTVSAFSGTLQGTATWVVGSDLCHIYKVTGTETLIIR